MESKTTVIFDNKEIDAIKDVLHKNDDNHRKNTDYIIFFDYLDRTVEKKSKYTILPQRKTWGQFINQHNIPVSEFQAFFGATGT